MSYRDIQSFPLNKRYDLDVRLRECMVGIEKVGETYSDRVELLLRFPSILMEEFLKMPEEAEKFSFAYLVGNDFVLASENMFSLHYEGPRSLVIYRDKDPIAVVSFQDVASGILITQIQGNKRYKWGRNKHGMNVMFLQPHNNDLSKFAWSKVLVRAVEEIAKLERKERVLILPHSMNRWSSVKHNEAGQGEKNYDITAGDLGYLLSDVPEIQGVLGKKRKGQVYVKNLK